MAQLVSYRKFADMVGVSDTAVRKAIAAGYIVNGVIGLDTKRPKIDVDVACAEWGKPLIGTNDPPPEKGPVIQGTLKRKPKPVVVPVDVDDEDDDDPEDDDDLIETPTDEKTSAAVMTMVEAKRQEAVLKAKKLQIQIAEMEGRLVDKEAVYKKLFEKGQTIRSAILSIPDRISANLLACKSVTEANNLLTEELILALEKLSTSENNETEL